MRAPSSRASSTTAISSPRRITALLIPHSKGIFGRSEDTFIVSPPPPLSPYSSTTIFLHLPFRLAIAALSCGQMPPLTGSKLPFCHVKGLLSRSQWPAPALPLRHILY